MYVQPWTVPFSSTDQTNLARTLHLNERSHWFN